MTRVPDRGLWFRILGAAASGVVMAAGFPPLGWWPLTIMGVALLTLSIAGRGGPTGFGLGLLSGLVFFLVLVRWVSVVGLDAWILLAAYSALWIGLTGWVTAVVTRLRWWPIWVSCAWVAQEALRDRVPWGGWPWGRLAFGEANSPMLAWASIGGAPILTAAAALLGACLAGLFLDAVGGRLRGAAAAAVPILLIPAVGLLLPLPDSGQGDAGPSEATVAVIQGDVPEVGLDFNSQRRAVLDNHVGQTLRLAGEVARGSQPAPVAVIWPENSSDLDPYTSSEARAAIDLAADAVAAPILVGSVIANPSDPNTVLNVGIVWNPATGPGQRYVKQHPVPFGEYVPFRAQLAPLIGRFDRIPRDFAPGGNPGVLDLGPVRLGDVICFEVAYDDLVRATVTDGARMLAVQTNNATYTGTGQTEQQLAMARIRSVEHGRTVAVAATNGISAVYLPNGSLRERIPESTAGWIIAALPLRDAVTVSDVLGGWPEFACLLVTLATVAVGLRRPRGVWSAPAPRRLVRSGPGQNFVRDPSGVDADGH